MPSSDDEIRRPEDGDLDAAIDAFARRVERAIAARRRALDSAELEPVPLSPLDRVRSALSPPDGPDADSSPATGGDTDSRSPTGGDADPSTRDDNP